MLPVHSEGFKGTKKDGYRAACEALFQLIGTGSTEGISPHQRQYPGRLQSRRRNLDDPRILRAHGRPGRRLHHRRWTRRRHPPRARRRAEPGAMLRLDDASGEDDEGAVRHPFKRVSYFGIEDMAQALYDTARFFKDPAIMRRTQELVREEVGKRSCRRSAEYGGTCKAKRPRIYVGGAFKAFSLVRALRLLGMETVLVGSQTGSREDYEQLANCAIRARSSWMIPIRWNWRDFSRRRRSICSSAA